MNDPRPEYLSALFTAEVPAVGLPPRFAIVTACNRDGRPNCEDENRKANKMLLDRILSLGLEHFPATGGSPDGSHLEPGFAVVADSPETIRDLAKRFHQEAFYWVEDGEIFLIDTRGTRKYRVGDWTSRVRK